MSDITPSPTLLASKKDATHSMVCMLEECCETFAPGDRLPTRSELVAQFKVSERVVLKVLDELERSGKIVRRQGAGIFVAPQRVLKPMVTKAAKLSNTIVAIGPHDHSFFDHCMHLLLREVEAVNLTLVCRLVDPQTDSFIASLLENHQPRGFILFRYDSLPLARQLQQAGQRVVLIGAPHSDAPAEIPCVYGDNEHGSFLVTRHLIELGHRRLVFHGPPDYTDTRRWHGHLRAISEARRTMQVESSVLMHEAVEDWVKEPERALAYFRRPDCPTGFLAWNDSWAALILSIFFRIGIKVPEAVSVVGYDNLPQSALLNPALTTVEHSVNRQLQAAIRLLTSEQPPAPSHTTVFVQHLVPRDSSTWAPTSPKNQSPHHLNPQIGAL